MVKQPQINTGLVGKPIEELSPDELQALASELSAKSSEVEARRQAIKEQLEKEQFDKIATTAKEVAQTLGWQKLPPLTLAPDVDGENYTVDYAATKAKGEVKRTTPDVNNGDITIHKISVASGGIACFRDKEGNEYKKIQDLVKALKNPKTGEPEADRCWDITKSKGISASDIVIKYHADEVTLIFNDGTNQLVKDAVDHVESAIAVA